MGFAILALLCFQTKPCRSNFPGQSDSRLRLNWCSFWLMTGRLPLAYCSSLSGGAGLLPGTLSDRRCL